MTEINHNLVKQQMVDILQNNTTLFDVDNEAKITYLEVGEPPGNPFPTPSTYPALWITNARTLETISRKGTNDSNRHSYLIHDVTYQLKLMVVEQDSIIAEKQLDNLQKLIMETLENDITLSSGSQTLTISPDDTWPERVETFRQELDGQAVRGKSITWHLQFATN
jgi:hypothetical protein